MKNYTMRLSKIGIMLLTLISASGLRGQVSILTQHNDNARTGQNLSESTLNTSNVSQSTFGKLFWRTVDGFIYAQPLYVSGLTVQGTTHNVVFVATQHNSVYAFDADDPNSPAPLWQVNLGNPVPMEDICIITGDNNPGDCPYFDISPEIGITSTPVIDPVGQIIYVVNRIKNVSDGSYHIYLHALNLTTGSEELGGPVEITGQVSGTGTGNVGGVITFDPTYHNQRPSLLLSNGVLYIAFGSVGDIGTWHGWVMSYNASTLQQESIFNVAPDGSEGGIWSAGQGLVADTSGNVYLITGNGDFNANLQGGRDYGDSFVKFTGPSLAVSDYFTPFNQGTLNADNTDLGAGGPMLMPGTTLLVGQGKDSVFRVVNSTNMGKYNSSFDNDVQEFTATTGPFFSSPIYWNSPNFGPVVYLWGPNDFLKAFQLTGSQFNTTPASQGTIQLSNHFSNAAALSLSANGSLSGTGIVWTSASISGKATGIPVPGVVRAFDATNLSRELWDSTQNLARDDVGNYAKFVPPTVANGKVYAASFNGQLQVYGLNPPPFQGIQFVQVASATPQSNTTSVAVAYPQSQTAGNLNVVIVGWNDSTASVQSVSDSLGNTYTPVSTVLRGTSLSQAIYYAKNITTGSGNTVTVTFNQAAVKPDLRILEYSGVDPANPLDVTIGAGGNSYIADSGYLSTRAANELIVGADMVSGNTTIMGGAPLNIRVITTTDSDLAADYQVNVPGSYHTWAPLMASGSWLMQAVAFRSATVSAVPFVTSVTPNSGAVGGGTAVTITGMDFAVGATVTFGGAAATNVVVVNSTTMTATTPAGSAGPATVTVTNPSGLNGSLSDGFTYLPAPTVTSVSPSSGSISGGTAVTIAGANFLSGATVTFGGTAATNVVVVNSATITATTPAHALGAVTVTVTNPGGQAGSLTNGFTYVNSPTVTNVSPNSGPVSGGTAVTITGTNFVSGATVAFGSNAATNVVVVSGTSITATTPAGSAGSVTVTVTNPGGLNGSLTNGFTYIGTPTVTSVTPNNGPTGGGTAVTITGTNFATGATVTFGSSAATNVVVVNSTSITATTPPGSAGAVTVTVTNSGGQAGSLANGFTYTTQVAIGFVQVAAATPQSSVATVPVTYPGAQTQGNLNVVVVGWNDTTSTVQSVSDSAGNIYSLAVGPTSGTGLRQSIYYAANIVGGSNTVTVTFSQAAALPDVRVLEYRGITTLDVTAGASGSSASASSGSATTTSANELIFGANMVATGNAAAGSGFTSRIITIPDSDLAEDKVVTAAGSNSATATLTGAGPWVMQMATFSAVSGPLPTVTSVSPSSGSTAGGTAVTITGTNFVAGATVTFAGAAATNVVVVNSTSITATTPAGSAGAVTVTVTNPGGQAGSLTNGYTYVASPTVASVSPNSGTTAGGTAITIAGTNFVTGATVTFGGTAATNVVVVSSTSITATTPAHAAGAVAVAVTNPGGLNGSLANGFTYVGTPTLSGVSPNSGTTSGGTAVTIAGTNFASGATVTFGGTAATNVVVVSSTSITATTPAHAAGAVTVTVTNPGGLAGSLTNGYTYVNSPTVASVSPNSGTTAGGTAVTITGTNFTTGATVTFGGTAATNVVVVSGTSITATTPAHAAGAVAVAVTNPGGLNGSLANGFTYIGTPTVTSVTPNNGPTGGGTAVTITGTNFATGATVTFGSSAATNVVVVNSTSITATTPAGSAGAVTVTVTNPGGLAGSLANGFTYTTQVAIGFVQVAAATPQSPVATVPVTYPGAQTQGNLNVVVVGWNDTTSTVQSVRDSAGNTYSLAIGPTSGTGLRESIYYAANIVGGSNTVTVTFSQAAAFPDVRVLEYRGITTLDVTAGASGSSASASSGSATTTSANELIFGANMVATGNAAAGTGFTSRIITNPDSDLAEDKVVTAAGSNSATATLVGAGPWVMQMVTFSAVSGPMPTVTSVSPSSGSTAGGTAVTITGTNFVAGATVTFGSAAATNVVVVSSTSITATTPAGSVGAVTVTVTNPGGRIGNLANGYTYVLGPTVTNASPNYGPVGGGTAVTITGTNFVSGATVTIGSAAATNVVVVNGTTITATTSAGSVGLVTVAVTNPGGLNGSLANGFTYIAQPTVTSVNPNNGTTLGGTAVSITGTNFAAGATVTFGSTAATNVVVVNSTTITAVTPAGTAGAVAVTVTNLGPQSGSLANGYTYIVTAGLTAPGNFSGALAGTTVPVYVAGQQYYNATSGTLFTSSPFNSTGADLLVVFLGCHNNTVFTITDSYGNTWLPLAGPAFKVGSAGFPMEGEFFYAPNARTGSGHTITVNLNRTEPLVMSIAALAGDNTYSPIDSYSSITGDNGTISKYVASTSVTTSQPNDLLLGIVKGFDANTYAAGTGLTNQAAGSGINFAAETGPALLAGNYISNFTAANQDFWQSVIAAVAPVPSESSLSWSASSGGIVASYLVERCSGVNCSNFAQIASVNSPTLTYADTTIAPGTVYNYRVRAESSSGTFSPYSTVQAQSPIIPYVVTSLATTPAGILSWNPSAEQGGSVSQYSVERCAGAGCSNFAQVGTTANTGYADSSVLAGTTYNYRVRAQDANGFYGPYSAAVPASIPAYFDNVADGGNNGGSSSSLTYSFTVGSNANRLLLVSVVGDTSVDDISSVTYAGSPMTRITKVLTPGSTWQYLYYLLSPVSGSNNVVITAASSHYLLSEASSWYNIAQSGQPAAFSTNTAASGVTLTTSLPASPNNAIVAESMWSPMQVLPNYGSSELVSDATFQSLGMFASVPSPVTQAYPTSITNTWGGQEAASSIMASFTLAGNGAPGITFDNSADGGNNAGSTTSLTYPYTVGSGANRLLLVNLVGDGTADDIASVTYNGTAMTLIGKIQAPSNNWQYLYYLLNPSSGSHNVVITANSAHYLISEAASWYNVRQTGQPDAFTTNAGIGGNTAFSSSLTAAASGDLVVEGLWSFGHLAPGPGATPIVTDVALDGAGIFASSGSPVASPGSVTMTISYDGTLNPSGIMASFAPAP